MFEHLKMLTEEEKADLVTQLGLHKVKIDKWKRENQGGGYRKKTRKSMRTPFWR